MRIMRGIARLVYLILLTHNPPSNFQVDLSVQTNVFYCSENSSLTVGFGKTYGQGMCVPFFNNYLWAQLP